MTATNAKGLEVIADEPTEAPMRAKGGAPVLWRLLADLAEWAHEIRSRPWEGAKPWPTSSL
ncbi:hypothetical protein ACFQ05_11635 [Amycolatopsis umgeniensis]|uniref:Uncharacterized protein n=1 Tax=Amycolatopsis umgeniensis TaxID=336628 RepID=A0A841B4V3_9PSEU|nr:hypothetical protein [Amycolatopsis umgeniensis]MBB5853951.1 hypothetical protein [Amycolatopsis umgeniensis]